MSDTPRTDAACNIYDLQIVAEDIERELNAANEMLRKLNIHALNLTDRIRRLEEAGDLMVQHFYTDEPRSEMWEKAKEAKL